MLYINQLINGGQRAFIFSSKRGSAAAIMCNIKHNVPLAINYNNISSGLCKYTLLAALCFCFVQTS